METPRFKTIQEAISAGELSAGKWYWTLFNAGVIMKFPTSAKLHEAYGRFRIIDENFLLQEERMGLPWIGLMYELVKDQQGNEHLALVRDFCLLHIKEDISLSQEIMEQVETIRNKDGVTLFKIVDNKVISLTPQDVPFLRTYYVMYRKKNDNGEIFYRTMISRTRPSEYIIKNYHYFNAIKEVYSSERSPSGGYSLLYYHYDEEGNIIKSDKIYPLSPGHELYLSHFLHD